MCPTVISVIYYVDKCLYNTLHKLLLLISRGIIILYICIFNLKWVNTHLVLSHEIGHLPFQRDITANLKFGRLNRITVAVDNVLLQTTVPQGSLQNIST